MFVDMYYNILLVKYFTMICSEGEISAKEIWSEVMNKGDTSQLLVVGYTAVSFLLCSEFDLHKPHLLQPIMYQGQHSPNTSLTCVSI